MDPKFREEVFKRALGLFKDSTGFDLDMIDEIFVGKQEQRLHNTIDIKKRGRVFGLLGR